VLDTCYAALLSNATLDWLVRNAVVTSSQCGDAAAILRGIGGWLERTQPNPARAPPSGLIHLNAMHLRQPGDHLHVQVRPLFGHRIKSRPAVDLPMLLQVP